MTLKARFINDPKKRTLLTTLKARVINHPKARIIDDPKSAHY